MTNRFPSTSKLAVIVEEVDTSAKVAHVRDKFGGKFQIPYDTNNGGIVFVPMINETWVVSRDELQWAFVYRIESAVNTDRVPTDELNAGDTKIRAGANLHMDTGGITVNGLSWGLTTWERFTLVSDTDTITLANPPLDIRSVQVHNNRSLVDPFGITMSDVARTLTFSPALSPGIAIIYYQYIPTAIKVDELLS